MPRQRQFYEPEVQPVQAQASPIRGFQIGIGGTYVLMDDVVTVLREFAQSMDAHAWDATGVPDPREVLYEVATWLQSGERPPSLDSVQDAVILGEAGDTPEEPSSSSAVDRIEVYPDDPMAIKPRWVARACSADGDILTVTNGSFDQEYVIKDAQQRWPNRTVHLLTEAGQDSVWEERDPGGIRSASSGRKRPSPKRMYLGVG
jgi:hypothetical protein